MVRGTFANVRLRNKLAPGTEGGVTRLLPEGEQMSIFDASVKYAGRGTPLVILAGKEYGSGSSRDWAAKGPKLLGVRAVIAESYERIHRSNLVGMGILPLQFADGQNVESLGLTGEEIFDFPYLGVRLGAIRTGQKIETISPAPGQGEKKYIGQSTISDPKVLPVVARYPNGDVKVLQTRIRIDTPQEILYYEHGGILQYVLRGLAGRS
jgi:aconitate hydratase